MQRLWVIPLIALGFWAAPVAGSASCKLAKMAELPVTMSHLKPLITAQINGEDARFVVDSGSYFSLITQAGAAEFKLKLTPAPFGVSIKGIGGTVDASITAVKVFTLAGTAVHNVEFLVGGSTAGKSGSVGILGQNVLGIADVEHDLAGRVIRLMQAEDCGGTALAYWAKPSEPYSVVDIEPVTPQSPHIAGAAYINGARIRVVFDSGAGTSILST